MQSLSSKPARIAHDAAKVALRHSHPATFKKLVYGEKLALEQLGVSTTDGKRQVQVTARNNAVTQLVDLHREEYHRLVHFYKHQFGIKHEHEANAHFHLPEDV